MMKNMKKKQYANIITFITMYFIILPLLVLGFFYMLIASFKVGAEKTAIHECLTWQQQSIELGEHYYLLQWQVDQCEAVNIKINAPVK